MRERLAGIRIGDMRVLARCEDREVSNGRVVEQWLCRCACGALQKRVRSNIVRALRTGENMACYSCRAETRRGIVAMRREVRSAFWSELWARYGDLYFDAPRIKTPNHLDVSPHADAFDYEESPNRAEQRMAELYPIDVGENRALRCEHCGHWFHLLFGCVRCLKCACIECVRRERHAHRDPDSWTLEAIGDQPEFKVQRERVRQIEGKALRKLRHPSRAHRLGEFHEKREPVVDPNQGVPPVPRPLSQDVWTLLANGVGIRWFVDERSAYNAVREFRFHYKPLALAEFWVVKGNIG